ncbi:polysaccharide biosynthesis/export family protein [Roseovarius atlanticus]|uniref:polysaccharide biosynthesis/export family protein n=1 Tax=Roseovarius atlanticus TaxID=1641875 RepID=UPI0021BDA8DE|nr:polysaccharide biosynthesis/export family protein [Roseovarius atlanticus]
MLKTIRFLLLAVSVVALTGCALPRGAAVQSEILKEQRSENPSFQLVEVTRELTPLIAKWPHRGASGKFHWFGADQGPDSSAIQTGDTVKIVVWDSEDNSLLTGLDGNAAEIPPQEVSATGRIFLPYVGEVSVRGLTPSSARARLQAQFEQIQPSAQVQLAVTPGRNNSVDVVGGVAAPGRYPLDSRNTKILGVVAQSGGVNPALRNPMIRLQRGGRTYETRVSSLLENANRNVRVVGGDQIVVVEDERSFTSLGATGAQKVIYFEKERMTVVEALSSTSGLNAGTANPKGVLVLRDYQPRDLKPGLAGPNKQQVVFSFDLTSADGLFAARQFFIQPDDTLYATESPINSARTVIGLFGTIIGVTSSVNNVSN